MSAAEPSGLFVGLTTLDLVHRVERFPRPDEKITATGQDLAAGGPAANAAVTYAALGGSACLLTALGEHPTARLAHAELAERAVEVVDAAAVRRQPLAVSAVAVDAAGARTVTSVNAVGVDVVPPPDLADLIAAADILLLDGHHPALAVAAATAATAAGVPVLLDAGSWKPILDELLPLIDVAICSSAFTVPGSSAKDPLDDLLARGVPLVAVTAGPSPVRWRGRDGKSGMVPVRPVHAVDTLGAGDVFHGAAAYALATGHRDPAEVLAFAADVAALRCSVVGPRAWLSELGNRPRRGP